MEVPPNHKPKRDGFFVHSMYHDPLCLPMDLEEDTPLNHLVRVVVRLEPLSVIVAAKVVESGVGWIRGLFK